MDGVTILILALVGAYVLWGLTIVLLARRRARQATTTTRAKPTILVQGEQNWYIANALKGGHSEPYGFTGSTLSATGPVYPAFDPRDLLPPEVPSAD